MTTSKDNNTSVVAQILQSIEAAADASYAHFCGVRTKCTVAPETVIGIRMGTLRQAMKDLLKGGMDYPMAQRILLPKARLFYEYKILYGGVVQKVVPDYRISDEVNVLLSLSDGWASCDYFTEPIAYWARHGHSDAVTSALTRATTDDNPFARRLSVVSMIKLHKYGYMTTSEVLGRCAEMQDDDEYYIHMAIAWVLAEIYVTAPDDARQFMHTRLHSQEIRTMLIRKLKDSFRIKDY